MSGHSKWANMKHRKARQDAKRTKVFTKIIRELTVAAKGGANPADNPRLRAAVDKAFLNNLKKKHFKLNINNNYIFIFKIKNICNCLYRLVIQAQTLKSVLFLDVSPRGLHVTNVT